MHPTYIINPKVYFIVISCQYREYVPFIGVYNLFLPYVQILSSALTGPTPSSLDPQVGQSLQGGG
jgi:hypothetical protein